MSEPAIAPLQDELAAVLSTLALPAEARLCCAYSGGVDSTVLLHGLAALRVRFGFRLEAAHVHHGLSPNADAWAAFCADQCAALGIPLHRLHVDVARKHPEGLEAAARHARHAALGGIACDWLVFGHHQDDQAETLLFRLLRGAGVRGAAAMAAVTPGRPGRLRPLLGLRRAAIEAAARRAGLTWVEDESNADPAFSRNRLRHQVLPAMETAFPATVPALARAADNFREAGELLDQLAELDARACGAPRMALAALLALSPARLGNLLRWQIRLQAAEAPSRARLAEAVRQLHAAAAHRPLRLALGELACCAYRGEVWLEDASAPLPQACAWRGEACLPWGGGSVALQRVAGDGLSLAALHAAGEVVLRTRWPGMGMRLHAGGARRSFKKLCQEAGVPPWLRERLPVLSADGEAVWIGGIGMAGGWRAAAGEAGIAPQWRTA